MDRRLRAWSIVALSLLSAVLSYVLLRTPPRVQEGSEPARQARSAPAAPQPSSPAQGTPTEHLGWPFFFGWPLPELPSDYLQSGSQGTGGSPPALPPASRPEGEAGASPAPSRW